MPASKTVREPSYRYHKARKCAVVTIDGKNHYLGKFDSTESREKYHRLINEWLVGKSSQAPPPQDDPGPTVDELILRYWTEHVTVYYRKNGEPTSEQHVTRNAMKHVRRLYGSTRAADFGPLALKAVREAMVRSDRCRTAINRDVHRVRGMFRWAAEQEILPVSLYQALQTVKALGKGRGEVRESDPVKPVSVDIVNATLPFLLPQVRAMVEIQLLTGARPGEVASMRPSDVDQSDPSLWIYTPESHKTEHHDASRAIYLGPKARSILSPYLDGRPSDFPCFSPREAVSARNAERRANRRTPMTPSQRERSRRANPAGRAKDQYDVTAYRKAIAQACDRAFLHPTSSAIRKKDLNSQQRAELKEWRSRHRWHPHQLRHTAATEIRTQFGLEAAQAVLGHGNLSATQIYAEKAQQRAREAMSRIG